MALPQLTLRSLKARPLLLPLKRPVVARIATIDSWPLILIDLETEEGVVGRAYLEPYVPKSMNYLVPALHDMGEMLKGQRVAPVEFFRAAQNSLHFVGYEGLAMIAASGLDMVAWDCLARASDLPLCVMLGGSVGPVASYNSNALWLRSPAEVAAEALELIAEGDFKALKFRMGRERLSDDLATAQALRDTLDDNIELMVDFNQGMDMAEALSRCHAIDDLDLVWIEEPIIYNDFGGYAKLASELKTPLQIGENFYGVQDMYKALDAKACDLVMPDFMRIGGVTGWLQAAGLAAAANIPMSTHLYPEVAAHVMRVTRTAHLLEWQDWAEAVLAEPYQVVKGKLEIPDRPGLGLDWDEEAVARYQIE